MNQSRTFGLFFFVPPSPPFPPPPPPPVILSDTSADSEELVITGVWCTKGRMSSRASCTDARVRGGLVEGSAISFLLFSSSFSSLLFLSFLFPIFFFYFRLILGMYLKGFKSKEYLVVK